MTSESIVYLVGVLDGEHFRLKGKLLPVSQKPNLLISVESIVSYRTVVSHGDCQQYPNIIYAVFTGIKKLSLDKWQTLSQGDLKKTHRYCCVQLFTEQVGCNSHERRHVSHFSASSVRQTSRSYPNLKFIKSLIYNPDPHSRG